MIYVRANWLVFRSNSLISIDNSKDWNDLRSKLVSAGETKEEAMKNNAVYFLSDRLCKKHPMCRGEDGIQKINKTVRYVEGNRCALCKSENRKISKVRRRNIKEGADTKAPSRRRAEDIKEANALGLTLKEYLEIMK